MNKVKGITVGTYLTKTIKNPKDKGLSSKEICNHCKMKDNCKYRQITKFENGKVIHNKEINRIQFLFDNIPDEDTRKILKSYGFRWSRYEKAWQRVFNLNCIRATNIIVKEIAEKSKEKEEDEEFE